MSSELIPINNDDLFPLVDIDGKKFVDSRDIAKGLEIDHHSFTAMIYKYQEEIESRTGRILFKIESTNNPILGGKAPKHAFLTEDQGFYLITLSRNSPRVLDVKWRFVQTFQTYRKLLIESQNALIEIQNAAERKEIKQLSLKTSKLEKTIAEQKQYIKDHETQIDLAERCLHSINTETLEETARGLRIGRNKLYAFMRIVKLLTKKNKPYQRYINQGWFSSGIKLKSSNGGDTRHTVYGITGLGMCRIWEKYNDKKDRDTLQYHNGI